MTPKGHDIGKISVIFAFTLILLVISCEDTEGKIRDANDAARTNPSSLDDQNPSRKSSFDLRVGDCYNDSALGALDYGETTDIDRVEIVSCSGPHEYEVVELIFIDKPSGAPYPGESYFEDVHEADCPLETAFYLYPIPESWELDDRVVTCIAE